MGLNESHPVHAGSGKQTVRDGGTVISPLESRTGQRPAGCSTGSAVIIVCVYVVEAQVWPIKHACATLSERGRGTCSV